MSHGTIPHTAVAVVGVGHITPPLGLPALLVCSWAEVQSPADSGHYSPPAKVHTPPTPQGRNHIQDFGPIGNLVDISLRTETLNPVRTPLSAATL